MRVLLVEDDPADARLVLEALAEIEESRRGPSLHGLLARHAAEVEEAALLLAAEHFDVILTACRDLGIFLRLRAAAPDTPVIVLVSADDEPLGIAAVREGAQDYLVKSELDCLPLARSMRCAMERHRLADASRRLSLLDDATGVLSCAAFLTLADRDLRLACQLGIDAYVLVAEIDEDVLYRLHSSLADTAVIGRLDKHRFAAITLAPEPPLLPSTGLAYCDPLAPATIEELLPVAERALCENMAGGQRSLPALAP